MHIYGCRVIQRILENCPVDCTDPIYDDIIKNIVELTQDQYGNYVIQLILEKGTRPQDKKAICHALLGDARNLSVHKYASNVVEKCIKHCEKDDKTALIEELFGDKDNLSNSEKMSLYKIMDNKYGNYVIQKAIEEASPEQREVLAKMDLNELAENQTSSYIKHVIN